jgi:hypothetical protein
MTRAVIAAVAGLSLLAVTDRVVAADEPDLRVRIRLTAN